MEHPTVPKAFERFIDPEGYERLFFIGPARFVLTLVPPAGHEATVFPQHNPVFGYRGPIKQIAETGRRRSVGTERSILFLWRIHKRCTPGQVGLFVVPAPHVNLAHVGIGLSGQAQDPETEQEEKDSITDTGPGLADPDQAQRGGNHQADQLPVATQEQHGPVSGAVNRNTVIAQRIFLPSFLQCGQGSESRGKAAPTSCCKGFGLLVISAAVAPELVKKAFAPTSKLTTNTIQV